MGRTGCLVLGQFQLSIPVWEHVECFGGQRCCYDHGSEHRGRLHGNMDRGNPQAQTAPPVAVRLLFCNCPASSRPRFLARHLAVSTDAEAAATGTLGELDMMEATGGDTAYQTAHTASGQPYQASTTNASLTTGYNTYGLLWTPTSVTYYFNGEETGSYNVTIYEPMYMMLDLDVAGPNNWVVRQTRRPRRQPSLISALSGFTS